MAKLFPLADFLPIIAYTCKLSCAEVALASSRYASITLTRLPILALVCMGELPMTSVQC
jgi:hypothetical protein